MIAAKRKILSDNCQLKTLLYFTATIGFEQWLQDFESSGISFLQLGHIAISIFYSLFCSDFPSFFFIIKYSVRLLLSIAYDSILIFVENYQFLCEPLIYKNLSDVGGGQRIIHIHSQGIPLDRFHPPFVINRHLDFRRVFRFYFFGDLNGRFQFGK